MNGRERKGETYYLQAGFRLPYVFVLCCVIFQPERKSNRNIEAKAESSFGEATAVAVIEITITPGSEAEQKHCTDPETIRRILSCLEGKPLYPSTQEEACGIADYIITVINQQGDPTTYMLYKNGYLLTKDGSCLQISEKAAIELKQLISELKSD